MHSVVSLFSVLLFQNWNKIGNNSDVKIFFQKYGKYATTKHKTEKKKREEEWGIENDFSNQKLLNLENVNETSIIVVDLFPICMCVCLCVE